MELNYRALKREKKMSKFKYTQFPTDGELVLKDPEHEYFYNDEKIPMSVTQTAEMFFEPFNYKRVARNIHQKYPHSMYWNKDLNVIEDKLRKKGDNSMKMGTEFHRVAEYFYTNGECISDITYPDDIAPQVKSFLNFASKWKKNGNVCVGVEVLIMFMKLICGAVDALFWNTVTKQLYMVDWKRAKCFKKGEYFSKKQGKYPMDCVKDTSFGKYVYQQNMYKFILSCYGVNVDKMFIVRFHNEDFEVIEIEDLQDNIKRAIGVIVEKETRYLCEE